MNATRDMFGFSLCRTAEISKCGRYRWALGRYWNPEPLRVASFGMLNPSDADADRDDPTMLRVMAFAQSWGFDGVEVWNAYPFRSPHPSRLRRWLRVGGAGTQKVLAENRARVLEAVRKPSIGVVVAACGVVVAAWGAGAPDDEPLRIAGELRNLGVNLHCLGTTAEGYPKHPLARGRHRIPESQQPIPWEIAP